MSYNLRIFETLTVLGLLAASLGPAKAAQLQLNTSSPHSCAVVEGGNTASGTPVIAYSCSGGPEEQWEYVNGQLLGIGTANGKSMCLDVTANGIAPGTLVDLWPCNGGFNQQWSIIDGSIVTAEPEAMGDLCLDSEGGPSTGGGTQLVINECTYGPSQNWIVRGLQIELNASAPYLCVNVSGGDTANGTPVITYSCDDGPAQVWSLENDQILGTGTENGVSKCLTAAKFATAGSLVNLTSCSSSLLEQQAWNITVSCDGGASHCIVLADAAYLCLDSSGGPSVGGGTQLVVNTCSNAASQNWNVR